MDGINDRIVRLIGEYLTKGLQESQKEELAAWIEERKENRLLFDRIARNDEIKQRWSQWKEIDVERAIRLFDKNTRRAFNGFAIIRRVLCAAVAAAVVVSIAVVLCLRNNLPVECVAEVETIVPGSDKAVLILANGEKMRLEGNDSLQIDLGNGKRLVNQDKQLVYQGGAEEILQYNELRVPKGGEYQVQLADSSTVRLNSASSLKYPVVFGRDKREVALQGEAYFEVAQGEAPFYVKVGTLTLKVYGTAFNISTHKPNRILTTLAEGKVSLFFQGKEYALNPFQVADFDLPSGTVEIRETDIVPYLAWTKGLFVFNNQSLEEIMATLSLWYDVEVFFQRPSLQQLHFTGCVKRYESIDIILKALSQSVGVKINKNGRVLVVSR